jgi:hypothetical protein
VGSRPVVPDTTDLFAGPFLQGARGTGVLTMSCNGRRRTLDFTKATIVEH